MSILNSFILAIDIVMTPININNFIEGKKINSQFLIYSSIFSQLLLTFSFIRLIYS